MKKLENDRVKLTKQFKAMKEAHYETREDLASK